MVMLWSDVTNAQPEVSLSGTMYEQTLLIPFIHVRGTKRNPTLFVYPLHTCSTYENTNSLKNQNKDISIICSYHHLTAARKYLARVGAVKYIR